jgi:hypothetical protein
MRRVGPTKSDSYRIREAPAQCGRQDIFVLTFFDSFLGQAKKEKDKIIFISDTND